MPEFLSKKYSSHYLLALILLLAVFLRVWGLDYGLPYFFVGDERAMVYEALKMGELRTLIPAFHPQDFKIMEYPPLIPYVYLFFLVPFILIQYLAGAFSSFGELADYFILNPASLWQICRLVTALMGTATVYLIYLIGKKAFNRWVGLIAASFLTFSFLHLQFSHFTRQWVPVLFFACLIMLFSLDVYKVRQRKHYLWTGLAAGLGFGAGYPSAMMLSVFALSHFLSGGFAFREKIKDRNLWLALGIFVLLASVFVFLHPQAFLNFTVSEGEVGVNLSSHLAEAKSVSGYLSTFAYYFKVLLFYEPVILIFSLLGAIFLLLKSKKALLVFLFWPFFYISSLYFLSSPQPRFAVLLLPWLIFLASFTIYRFSLIFKTSFIKIILVVLMLIYPLAAAFQYDYLLSQKDSRVLALEWVEKNIPAGAKIISGWSYINPVPTKEAILFQKELDENSLRVADEALLNLDDNDYPKPSYNVLKLAYLGQEKIPALLDQFVQKENYQYLLTALWENGELSPAEKSLIQKAQLIQEFGQGRALGALDINTDFLRPVSVLFSLKRLGTTTRIYQLQP